MLKPTAGSPTLTLVAEARWATLAAGFAREACVAAGFRDIAAQRLALAAEEVVLAVASGGGVVTLAMDDRRFTARLRVTLPAEGFDTAWLNPAREVPLGEVALDGLGLYAAARLVDRLTVERRSSDSALLLGFEVERLYPPEPAAPLPELASPAGTRVVDPDDATLALFLRWAQAAGQRHPELEGSSARLVDRRMAGEISARLLLDREDRPRAGLFWTRVSSRLAAVHGPFLLAVTPVEQPLATTALLDAMLGALARSAVAGVVALDPSPALPLAAFEPVGTLNGPAGDRPVMFRSLQEDTGGVAWLPPGLETFVTAAVRSLGLGRDLEACSIAGLPERGALMAYHQDRAGGHVTLRPLLAAQDAAEVAEAHLGLFRRQGISRIRALLSLGEPGEAAFAPGLLRGGLVPRALIPDPAGDLLVLEGRGDAVP